MSQTGNWDPDFVWAVCGLHAGKIRLHAVKESENRALEFIDKLNKETHSECIRRSTIQVASTLRSDLHRQAPKLYAAAVAVLRWSSPRDNTEELQKALDELKTCVQEASTDGTLFDAIQIIPPGSLPPRPCVRLAQDGLELQADLLKALKGGSDQDRELAEFLEEDWRFGAMSDKFVQLLNICAAEHFLEARGDADGEPIFPSCGCYEELQQNLGKVPGTWIPDLMLVLLKSALEGGLFKGGMEGLSKFLEIQLARLEKEATWQKDVGKK
jgi:hypothetical protein